MAAGVRGNSGWVLLGVLSALACGRAVSGERGGLDLGDGPRSAQGRSPQAGPQTTPPGVRPPEPPAAEPAPPPQVSEPEVSEPELPTEIPFGFPGFRFPDDARHSQLVAMFERECSACHEGPSAERDRFLDLEVLLSADALSPESAETSPLVLWLQYGDARREHAGVRVSAEELGVLVDYVNSVPADYTCPGYESVDRDLAQELMLLDLASRAPADRPFIRYVGALRATPATACTGGPPAASAFISLVNAISLSPQIVAVGEALEGGPIYALDLRDYGWTAPIDVDGPEPRHFDDRWSAIVAEAGPYALELQGPQADALKQQTQTPVPFLSASVLVATASVGRLYAALVGVGSDVNAVAVSLGVDLDAAAPLRAGRFGAGAQPDRVVTRHEQDGAPGSSWWMREELRPSSDTGLARDPVHYTSPGAEVLFTLPNGLFAFAIAGADGRRLDELPCTSDLPCAGPLRALTSVTCRGCHRDQPLEVNDQVLPFLDADPAFFAPELAPLIREQYRAELGTALSADQERGRNAILAAIQSYYAGDSVANTYHDFRDRPLDATRAANDLGVQVEQLRAAITTLGASAAELAPLLATGKIERELFTSHFQELACAIAGPRNLPSRCP